MVLLTLRSAFHETVEGDDEDDDENEGRKGDDEEEDESVQPVDASDELGSASGEEEEPNDNAALDHAAVETPPLTERQEVVNSTNTDKMEGSLTNGEQVDGAEFAEAPVS